MTDFPSQPSPHDALFKRVVSDLDDAGALLRGVLPPDLAARVDWSRLELRSGGFVDESLRGLTSDVVLSAPLGERPILFYLLVEHQSSPEQRMAWRMWRYLTRLWEREARETEATVRLPFVVPVVVYQGARAWNAPRAIAELIERDRNLDERLRELLPSFRYVLDDLTRLGVEGLRSRGLSAFGTLALWALRTASDRGFLRTIRELGDLIDELRASDTAPEALHTLFSYLSIISRPGEDLVQRLAEQLEPPARENVMDAIEMYEHKLRQESLEKGLEQGREQGREQGALDERRATLRKLLRLKFGELDQGADARVSAADGGLLAQWTERILTANSLDEVFAPVGA